MKVYKKKGIYAITKKIYIFVIDCVFCSNIYIDGKYYKIGITNKSIKERFISDSNDIKIIKEWYYDDGEKCYNMEQYYLKEFE